MSRQRPDQPAADRSAAAAACRVCGVTLATGALDSLCPACLLVGSLLPEADGDELSAPWVTIFPQLKIGPLVAGVPGVETYEAVYLADGSPVRLSVATSGHITKAGGLSWWKQQIEALDRLNHPNIARLLESGDLGNRFYLITEAPGGRTLQALLEAGELSGGKLEALVRQLNDAVASARTVGVYLTCSFGEVIVGDDGHAKLIPGLESAPPDRAYAARPAAAGSRAVGPGMQLGHYRVIDQIGEGGFAEVWLAHQEEPVQRRVALKVLKEGMDTRRVLARFEAERQALALLDHPNIARVFDAGATDGGRPFFVMEAVDGAPLTQWCEQAECGIEERLRLMIAVCAAVQHAHQRGIIHRDLKPSNVLVASEAGAGVPKVIDFGIAKAVERSLTEQTIFTRDNQVLGTPEYMSPEQAAPESAVVDSRSDVYGLGVLLYELLTGSTPIAALEARAKKSAAGFDELQRRIRDDDPAPPSTLVAATGKTGKTGKTGITRASLPPELDWVVMKALAKEPERRYQSAAELGEDLRRVLADEAVQAGAPTRSYRVRKFVRRHRVAVLSASAVVLALVAGVALALVGLQEARKERANALAAKQTAETAQQTAEQEAEIAETLNAFFREDLLGRANPNTTIDEKDVTLREAVDRAAATIEARFAERPEVLAAIHQSLANSYRGLSVPDRAERHGRRAAELYGEIYGDEHPKSLAATSLLASILKDSAGAEESLALHRKVAEARQKVLGAEDAATLRSRKRIGRLLFEIGQREAGERELREVLAVQRRVLGDAHADTQSTVRNLCQVLTEEYSPAKRAEAFTLMTAQVAAREEAHGKDSQEVMNALHTLAVMLSFDGRPEEAEPIQRRILEQRVRVFGEKSHDTLSAMNNLAFTLKQAGKPEEAVDLYRRALPLLGEVMGPEHDLTLTATNNLGTALTKVGQHEDALIQLRKAWELGCKLKGEHHPETLSTRMHLADSHDALGQAEECLKIYEEIVPPSREVLGETHPEAILRANNLAYFLGEAQRLEKAGTVWREVCAAAEQCYGAESLKMAHYLEELEWNLRERKLWKEAMPVAKRRQEIYAKHHGADDKRTLEQRLVWLTMFKQSGGTMTPEINQEALGLFNTVYGKNEDIRAERERQGKADAAKAEVEPPLSGSDG